MCIQNSININDPLTAFESKQPPHQKIKINKKKRTQTPQKKERKRKTAADCFVCISPHCEDGMVEMAIHYDWIVSI